MKKIAIVLFLLAFPNNSTFGATTRSIIADDIFQSAAGNGSTTIDNPLTTLGTMTWEGLTSSGILIAAPTNACTTAQSNSISYQPYYDTGPTRTTVAAINFQRTVNSCGNYDGQIKLQTRATGSALTDSVVINNVGNMAVLGDITSATFEGATSTFVANRVNDVISVKDYGAVGDGSTDDTTAIQNAVNASGLAANKIVFFPPGEYYVTGTITMHYGTMLQGTPSGTDLQGGTVIYHGSTANLFVWDGNNVAGNSTGGGMSGMQLLKKNGFVGGDAIYLVATSSTLRPGEMVFMDNTIFGEGHSTGGLWGRCVHIDGTAANTAGGRGVRSTYWIKTRCADFNTANQAWYLNQVSHMYGDIIVDPGDSTVTDGVTFDGFWDNVSLRFRSGSAVTFNHTGTPGTDFPNLNLTGTMGSLTTTYTGIVGTATLGLSGSNAVTNVSPAFMILANDADEYFGAEAATAHNMLLRYNAATVGGIGTTGGKISLFGGSTPASHISIDTSGNTTLAGKTTLGTSTTLGPIITGSAARGRQIQLGDSSTYSTLGVRDSGANFYIGYNAKQTTENTDSWTQVNTGDNSTKLNVDDSGISLYNAAASSSPAVNSTFWGSAVFSVSSAGAITGTGAAITALSGSNISSGTVATARGGTGLDTSANTDGQILIGATSGHAFALGTLTGTSNEVVVTNAANSITLATPQAIGTGSTVQFAKLGLGKSATATLDVAGSVQNIKNDTIDLFNARYDTSNPNIAFLGNGRSGDPFLGFNLESVSGTGTGGGTYNYTVASGTENLYWALGDPGGGGAFGIYTGAGGTAGSLAFTAVSATPAFKIDTSSHVFLSSTTTGTNADFLCLSSAGQILLQTSACTISSKRFKENIHELDGKMALDEILQLKPVEFNMKPGKKPNPDPNFGKKQTGLIAEDVANVDPRLAIYENDMKTPKSYRQEAVISLLVRAMQEQQSEINGLKKRLDGQ